MSKRFGAWRLAAALALGAALGPYHYINDITWGDTSVALGLVVAPLFFALWLDGAVRRKALATLLLLLPLVIAAVLFYLFFALGDQSAGTWFVVATWLIPGTAAFVFGCVGPRISATMTLGMGCAVVAALGLLAHVMILGILQPAAPNPCTGPHPSRCFQVHTTSAFDTLFLTLLLALLALGVVIVVFEGIMAVACRLWLTRLASGRTLLGAPRGTTLPEALRT